MSGSDGGGRGCALPRASPLPLLLALLAPACAPAADDAPAGEEGPPRVTPEIPPPPDMSPGAADSLRIRIELPGRVGVGDPVPITVRAENVTEGALTLYLRGRSIAFDVVVEDGDGAEVWRRLEGEVIPAVLRLETLPAGEALVLAHTWDQRSSGGEPLPPGAYTVRAELLTDGDPLASPAVPLRILPR